MTSERRMGVERRKQRGQDVSSLASSKDYLQSRERSNPQPSRKSYQAPRAAKSEVLDKHWLIEPSLQHHNEEGLRGALVMPGPQAGTRGKSFGGTERAAVALAASWTSFSVFVLTLAPFFPCYGVVSPMHMCPRIPLWGVALRLWGLSETL